MEMMAAIRGLEWLGPIPTGPLNKIFLASDSAYMLNTLKYKWYEDWFKYDKPRANLDLWERLVKLVQLHDQTLGLVRFVKIKGHADDETNQRVDKMAVQARKEKLEYENVIHSPSQPH